MSILKPLAETTELPVFTRKPWAFDDGRVILPDGSLLNDHACEFAADSAPEPPAPRMAVLTMPAWVVTQPSKKAMAEADLIASFYAGVPFATGERRHREYLERKTERSINHD